MSGRYILEGHEAVPCEDLMEWASWFETADRSVRHDKVGAVRVSTVFLGLDHQFGDGTPLIFETMVFGGPLDGEMDRCSTWDQAEKQHADILARVKAEAQ